MTKDNLSRILVFLLGGLLLVLLSALFVSIWQSGSPLSVQPAALGQLQVSFPEESWSWRIPFLLPLAIDLQLRSIDAIGDLPKYATTTLLGFLFSTFLLSVVFGLLSRSFRASFVVFLSAVGIFVIGILSLPLSWYIFGPQPANKESELILSLQDDLKTVVPEEKIVIPGQELISPSSPYFAGRVDCQKDRCMLLKRK